MSGEVMDVRHDDGFGALPSRAADTAAKGNTRARDRTLEGPQNELLAFHPIKPGPPETKGFVECSCHVRHVGNRV